MFLRWAELGRVKLAVSCWVSLGAHKKHRNCCRDQPFQYILFPFPDQSMA